MTKIKIDFEKMASEFDLTKKNILSQYRADEEGLIWDVSNPQYNFLIESRSSANLAGMLAILNEVTPEKKIRDFAFACLRYAKDCSIYYKGVWFWSEEYVATLCSQGRNLRQLYYAAKILKDKESMNWLGDFLRSWPFLPEEHRFVERFIPGIVKEHNRGTPQPFNMELEGAVDAYLVGKEIQNSLLMERARDVILNYFLPYQREDGLWDYGPGRQLEVNYSLYCLFLLGHLLCFPEWGKILGEPLHKSLQEVKKCFMFPDGSVYAPVHWGWAHIWESTLFYAYVGWVLNKYCGYSYSSEVARALNWFFRCRLNQDLRFGGDGIPAALILSHLIYEKVNVEGERANNSQILVTLRKVEEKIRAPWDEVHRARYYSVVESVWKDLKELIGKLEERNEK